MEGSGSRGHDPAGSRAGKRTIVAVSALALALTFGVAPVIGDGLNREATPNPVLVVHTVPATEAQGASAIAGVAGKKKVKKMIKTRKVTVTSRITDAEEPIISKPKEGTFVGIKCPGNSIAISGGVVTSYINLLVSSSAPNQPLTGKYTPRTWWLTVTNANIDGKDSSLPWRGIVNCMTPVKLQKG
jgi:hypothetical protein